MNSYLLNWNGSVQRVMGKVAHRLKDALSINIFCLVGLQEALPLPQGDSFPLSTFVTDVSEKYRFVRDYLSMANIYSEIELICSITCKND